MKWRRRNVARGCVIFLSALEYFWTTAVIFLWVVWFWVLIAVFIDIFRRPELFARGAAVLPGGSYDGRNDGLARVRRR
jgi:hypothetical protein